MNNEDGLLELRNKLDNIDNTLLDLINQRMKIVHEVGALKAKSGGAIYRPEREKSIIDRLEKINNEIEDVESKYKNPESSKIC